MEINLELFLTAFIALLFSFLIAKIVSLAMGGGSVSGVEEKPLIDADDEIIMEDLEFAEKLKVQGLESEKKVEFVKEIADTVDLFETEQAGVDRGFESEKKVEFVQETADKGHELEAGKGGVDEVVEGSESEKVVEFLQETAEKVEDFEAERAKVGEAEAEVKFNGSDVQKKLEKKEFGEIGEELEAENETKMQSEEIRVEESRMKGLGEEEKEVKLESDDDDWEGIEKSELEKVFADAAKFVERKGDLEGVGNDVQMELYGLHKIATEGPCREPQPLAFMVSSRSKWNAWQRLGNMNPEVAMGQYIALLSDKVPGWMEDKSYGEHKIESADPGIPGAAASVIRSFPEQQNITQERNAELKNSVGADGITKSSSFEKQAKD
ncbi:hypothetical protein DITRI_Ditri10aG0050700 [Diplodiscus trichospermus]